MTVSRMSISVPPEVEEHIRAAAEEAGVSVSTWVANAAEETARRQAKLADGRRAVREYEEEFGSIPEEYRRDARQFLVENGLLEEHRVAC